jgi:hypothetical protein
MIKITADGDFAEDVLVCALPSSGGDKVEEGGLLLLMLRKGEGAQYPSRR